MFTFPFAVFLVYQSASSFQEQTTFNMNEIVISDTNTRGQNNFTIQDDLTRNLDRLENIAQLEDDWDGYGAKSFSTTVIATVRNIISYLKEQPEIFPTGRGSVQLEYHMPDYSYLELEVFDDKVVVMQILNSDYDNAQFWELPSNEITKILNITHNLLNA